MCGAEIQYTSVSMVILMGQVDDQPPEREVGGLGYAKCYLRCFIADIVNLDLKSTLRVLYNLFTKYKSFA